MPPSTLSNFRAFVHSLKDAGVDMSHVSISRSYAVLVGLEAYVKTRRRGKKIIKKLVHHRDKLLDPEEEKKRLEAERDKSESAELERRYLEQKERLEHEEAERNRADKRLLEKLDQLRSRPRSRNSSVATGDGTKSPVSPRAHDSLFRHVTPVKSPQVEDRMGMAELHITPPKQKQPDPDIEAPGTGPENAIAPEGTRND
ncbi:hypothetical protein M7I_0160 [Glarea lozoyensis 74030]|uniref:Uncharacterized protein n=1 Tax=Glarea lozoyensis (strain ATCC 74030 / MF5533) TaxID=1104152 RepID=H0ECL8_GLAL7|nr:hypothetical protein M7I_0160 [Glarea lozoyensis 74030]